MDSDSEEEKPPAQTARGQKDKRGSAFMDSDSEDDGDAKPGALMIETESNGTAKVPATRGTVFFSAGPESAAMAFLHLAYGSKGRV